MTWGFTLFHKQDTDYLPLHPGRLKSIYLSLPTELTNITRAVGQFRLAHKMVKVDVALRMMLDFQRKRQW
jgi:hypothetical protein